MMREGQVRRALARSWGGFLFTTSTTIDSLLSYVSSIDITHLICKPHSK